MSELNGALARLASMPRVRLFTGSSPLDRLDRLRASLAARPALFVKRDDVLPFGFGGNKVRKLEFVAAEAVRAGADTLVTCGGVQSNHARATAAVAAVLGMRCHLVANGTEPSAPTGNARLDAILGARVHYVSAREDRAPAMEEVATAVRRAGGRPFVIPLGASTPVGALAYATAVSELLAQMDPPDVIVHATSSGGTQAGLIAGCRLHALATRVVGVSADDPAPALQAAISGILQGVAGLLGVDGGAFDRDRADVDATQVGGGYGVPTPESTGALERFARTEGIFLDPVYTAKAAAAFMERLATDLADAQSILFWHTGGLPGLFA